MVNTCKFTHFFAIRSQKIAQPMQKSPKSVDSHRHGAGRRPTRSTNCPKECKMPHINQQTQKICKKHWVMSKTISIFAT